MGAETITAAIYRGNRTFTVEQRATPVPGLGEVAVRIAYCGICGTDMHVGGFTNEVQILYEYRELYGV